MDMMFYDCDSLINASLLVVPKSVTSMSSCFYGCDLLQVGMDIEFAHGLKTSSSVGTLFANCPSLISVSPLPESLSQVKYNSVYQGCNSLEAAAIYCSTQIINSSNLKVPCIILKASTCKGNGEYCSYHN